MHKLTLLLSTFALPLSSVAVAQVPDQPQMFMPAGDKLGEIDFPNSGNAAAQAPFIRGVKLLHNFEYPQAIESFQAAEKADPHFVMAYWGEAMAHNYTLWAEQHTDEARAVLAKIGATKEERRAKAKTARERMWLDAVETLYGPGTKFERDVAYADKMDALAKRYPDDVEAQVFDALATLGRSHGVRDEAGYLKAAAILEKLFPTHQHHPGVVHYMIHSYDDPAHARLGLKAALLYDKIAPESPHALHMTSHIFLALGMWPETLAANRAAIAEGNQMGMARGRSPAHCGHQAIWLVYAELQLGQDASKDIDACRASFDPETLAKDKSVIGEVEHGADGWTDMVLRRGIETGDWPAGVELPAGHFMYGHFNLAYAGLLASRHSPEAAAAALQDMKSAGEAIAEALPKEMPDEKEMLPWLDRGVIQGRAVLLLARGQTEAGFRALKVAAEAEAALPPPFGPPALQKPSYEMLGDELLAVGRKKEAAAAYRAALVAAPNRRLSVLGLKAATTP
jgi:tetratricopeptide (TPR) repeat protein